ncbi:MAG: peptidylprolyl isomerase [Bernardetiaceae bacterium]|nr:peptidylprolyl isomerase [Bernardetiaceae bacterium]
MDANDYVVTISTDFGEIAIVLFEETPKHRENFLKLAKEGFYDNTMFHRVIRNFMIQGGDPNTKDPSKSPREYGTGGPDYKVPAEIIPGLTHKKGAVAAARQGDAVNPKKESSGSQFYIVQNANGTPHLDGEYSVFGQAIKGLDVIDTIAAQPVLQPQSLPQSEIRMNMRVEEMKRSEISEKYGYDFKR